MNKDETKTIAVKLGKTSQQILFRFLTQIVVVPLIGTCSEQHMKEDLVIFDFSSDFVFVV